MKKHLAASTAIVLALGLAGCSMPATGSAGPAEKPAAAADPSMAPSPEPEPKFDGTAAFGEAITYLDGVAISVSAPAAFTPGQYAAGHDYPHAITFNITITNGSDENLDPLAYGTLSSGGAEGSPVFDTGQGIGGGPTTVLLPGQTVTWAEAYSVLDPADLTFQISPSFTYDDAIFTTVAK